MAGPGASVLLRTDTVAASVKALRSSMRDWREYNAKTFYIGESPFLLCLDQDDAEPLDGFDDLEDLSSLLGWTPRAYIGFAAMCNQKVDHERLAQLCLLVAEAESGLVDFGGALSLGPDLSGSTRAAPMHISHPAGLDGALYATAYEIEPDRFGTCHYGDAAFLRSWMRHPQFRMVK